MSDPTPVPWFLRLSNSTYALNPAPDRTPPLVPANDSRTNAIEIEITTVPSPVPINNLRAHASNIVIANNNDTYTSDYTDLTYATPVDHRGTIIGPFVTDQDAPPLYYTVWWKYIPTTNGRITATLDSGGNINTVLQLLERKSSGKLKLLEHTTALLFNDVTAGTTYYLAVGMISSTNGLPSILLTVTGTASKLTDNTVGVVAPSIGNSTYISDSVDLMYATPVDNGTGIGQYAPDQETELFYTVWWKYTPVASGHVTAVIAGNITTVLQILKLNSNGTLTFLEQASYLLYQEVTAGTTYYFAAGLTTSTGGFPSVVLTVTGPVTKVEDDTSTDTAIWQRVGDSNYPIQLRMKNKTWRLFGNGGGAPLRLRAKTGKWLLVSTEGTTSGVILGRVSEFSSDIALVDKVVSVHHGASVHQARTDINGNYRIMGIPFGDYAVTAYRVSGADTVVSSVLSLTSQNPIQTMNLFFGDGINTFLDVAGDVNQVFLDLTGWNVNHHKLYENNYQDQADEGEQPDTYNGAPTDILFANYVSATGWIGDEANTHTRYIDENNSWYALPIGMFLKEMFIQYSVEYLSNLENNTYSWASWANLLRIDVIAHLTGYSVEKNQMPWENFYTHPETTIGLYPGVGALWYQGPTPIDNIIVVHWVTPKGNNVSYAVPVPRNIIEAEGVDGQGSQGQIIWAGDLNDLPGYPGLTVTQSFTLSDFSFEDSLQYHISTSALPPPTPTSLGGSLADSHTWENRLECWFEVRFVWRYW